ncbi:TIGR04222 domain-containing membrane protein [Nonomuraea sp. NPDC049309]|uniref:TIGR04222 domain-containing membrane protein n=1 Tax=Nonomuraea sp. NPDC049309 TaxID=3364350 RepID=UPI00371C472D
MNLFLLLTAVALALVAAAAAAARWRIAHGGSAARSGHRKLDVYELAYLVGGPERTAETAIVGLVSTGAVRLADGGHVEEVRAGGIGRKPVEEAVAGLIAERSGLTVGTLEMEAAHSSAVHTLGRELTDEGLLLADEPRARLRRWARLLRWTGAAALAGFVVTLLRLSGAPGTYGLIALVVFGGTAVAAGVALWNHGRYMRAPLTPSGRAALAAAREAEQGSGGELPAVALRGIGALPGSVVSRELPRSRRKERRRRRTARRLLISGGNGYTYGGYEYRHTHTRSHFGVKA